MSLIVVHQYQNEPDTYDVVGVDQPLGTLVKKETVNHYGEQENEVILTIKVPGHSYQYGAFSDMRSYAPAQYQVYRVISEERESKYTLNMLVKKLTSFPVRTPKGGE